MLGGVIVPLEYLDFVSVDVEPVSGLMAACVAGWSAAPHADRVVAGSGVPTPVPPFGVAQTGQRELLAEAVRVVGVRLLDKYLFSCWLFGQGRLLGGGALLDGAQSIDQGIDIAVLRLIVHSHPR